MQSQTPVQGETLDLLGVDRRVKSKVRLRRYGEVALWGGLIALGLRRRGVFGFAAAAFGVTRIAQTLSKERWPWPERSSWSLPRTSPDAVDQGSRMSFPASDPPAHGS